MAFVPFPNGARISNQILLPDYPGRVEHVSQSGTRQILFRGNARWRGTASMEVISDQAVERSIRSWITRMGSGVDYTFLPIFDSRHKVESPRYATFDEIPRSTDYSAGPPVVGEVGASYATISSSFGNVVVLNRIFPNMNEGCLVLINNRLHEFATYSSFGDSSARNNVTVRLWPTESIHPVGTQIHRALGIYAWIRSGAQPMEHISSPSWAGPWSFIWEEYTGTV